MPYSFESEYFSLPSKKTWDADELIESPTFFLEGLEDKELNEIAIKLWLELDDKGYMQAFNNASHTETRGKI